MESDWGLYNSFSTSTSPLNNNEDDEDDDYIQRYDNYYENYNQEIEEQEEIEEREEEYINIWSDIQQEEEEEEEEEEEKNKKRYSNHRSDSNKRKKKRKKKIIKNGNEIFFEIILSWKVNQLILGQRNHLNLPRLIENKSSFQTPQEFCDFQKQLIIEESRVSLLQGIQSPDILLSATYFNNNNTSIDDFEELKDGLIPLEFDIQNNSELIKPGWVYFLFPKNIENENIGDENIHFNKFNKKKQKKQTIFEQLTNDISINGYHCMSCTLATGKYAFISTTNRSSQIFWVSKSSLLSFRKYKQISLPQYWKIYGIENLITYQRMYIACHDVPNPPFMRLLIGLKQSRHIKFEDSENEDSNDNTFHDIQNKVTFESENIDDDSDNNQLYSRYSSILNQYQLSSLLKITKAVQKSVITQFYDNSTNLLHLIQGPPGCGKTHFLVHLIDSFKHISLLSNEQLNKGKKFTILVCAPSNKAISVVVEKYLSITSFNSWKNYPIVLSGVQEKLELCSSRHSTSISGYKHSNFIEGDDISFFEETFQDSKKFLQKITNEIQNILSQKQSSLNLQGFIPESLLQIIHTIIAPTISSDCLIYTYPQRYVYIFSGIYSIISNCINNIITINNKTSSHSLGLVFAVLNSIINEYYNIFEVLQITTSNFVSNYLIKTHKNIIQCLEKISRQIDHLELESTISNDHNCDKVSQDVQDIYDEMNFLEKYFDKVMELIKSYSNELMIDLLNHARILCSTLSSSGCYLMKSTLNKLKSVDILIVDEAGQCLESELLIPLYTSPTHLVLIGDPKQLPATVLSYEAQQLELGESTLYRLMYRCNLPYDILSIQYRMHPEICQFPNKYIYDDKLITANEVHNRENIYSTLISSISSNINNNCRDNNNNYNNNNPLEWLGNYIWIDVNGKEITGGKYGKSIANHSEAVVIEKLLLHFLSQKISLVENVGVLTFYNGQVNYLKKYLKESTNKSLTDSISSGLKIMSIDSCQGSEMNIIIISFVRCNKHSSIGFVKNIERLNVSLTRAKYILILIGSSSVIETSNSKILKQLVSDVKERNRFYDINDLEQLR